MTYLQPMLVRSLENIAAQLPSFVRTEDAVTGTAIVSTLLAEKNPQSAIKFAVSKTRGVDALTLIAHTFIRELPGNEHALLTLIGEVSFARYGQRPRESSGAILSLTTEEKIGLVWRLVLGQEQEHRVYDILTDAALETDDVALAEDLLVSHHDSVPNKQLGHLLTLCFDL